MQPCPSSAGASAVQIAPSVPAGPPHAPFYHHLHVSAHLRVYTCARFHPTLSHPRPTPARTPVFRAPHSTVSPSTTRSAPSARLAFAPRLNPVPAAPRMWPPLLAHPVPIFAHVPPQRSPQPLREPSVCHPPRFRELRVVSCLLARCRLHASTGAALLCAALVEAAARPCLATAGTRMLIRCAFRRIFRRLVCRRPGLHPLQPAATNASPARVPVAIASLLAG